MSNIVIIDHFSQTPDEAGNNRFIYLAEKLVANGNTVDIITTDFSHKNKKTRDVSNTANYNTVYGYKMLHETGYKKNVCLKRFYSHYIFGKNLKTYLKQMDRPDLVYISVPSLDVGVRAAQYCKKNNIPLIVDIQDLWPEAFQLVLNIPVIKNIAFSPLKAEADYIYRNATKIVAVSDTYMKRGIRVNKEDKKGLCVFLGTDLKKFDKGKNSYTVDKDNNEFWIGYAGTLGHSYNISIIIDAISLLKKRGYNNIVFKIMGDGPLMDSFKKRVEEHGICADFMGRMDYAKMISVLTKCDIAVNPISKGAAQSIINKHADYAAAALPVVNTQECEEYRSLIKSYECGINCDCEDTVGVADAIERLYNNKELREKMSHNSRKMAEEKFDRSRTYKQIIDLINTVINR